MPKFYHSSGILGFAYKARAVGFRRIFPFSLLPYLTGDIIQIHLSVKPLFEENRWQYGILQIKPTDYTPITIGEETYQLPTSDTIFEVEEWSKGRWWSETLSLRSGERFGQPCNITCSLRFQREDDDKIVKTTSVEIAHIEVVSRDSFLMNIAMWGFIAAITCAILILSIATLIWITID